MIWVDLILAAIILFGGISGFRQGFVLAILSFLAILLGVLGGFKLMGMAMLELEQRFDIDQTFLPYVAFAVVFIAIVIGVNLLGQLVKASISKTVLGAIDNVAGALVGLLKTAFMLSIVLWIWDSINLNFDPHRGTQWHDGSVLYPYVAGFAPKVTAWLSEIFPVFKDLF